MKFRFENSAKQNRNVVSRNVFFGLPRFRLWICYLIVGVIAPFTLAQTPGISVDSASSEAVQQNRNIELSTQFTPEGHLRVGDVVTFEVIVRWLDLGERLSTRLAGAPSVENFSILSSSTRSMARVTDEGRRMEEVYSFRLAPEAEGVARVGSVEVVYGVNGEEDGRLSSVAQDVTIEPPAKNNTLPLVIGAGVVFIVVVIGLIIVFIRRGRRSEESFIAEQETADVSEEALTEAKRWRMKAISAVIMVALNESSRKSWRNVIHIQGAE